MVAAAHPNVIGRTSQRTQIILAVVRRLRSSFSRRTSFFVRNVGDESPASPFAASDVAAADSFNRAPHCPQKRIEGSGTVAWQLGQVVIRKAYAPFIIHIPQCHFLNWHKGLLLPRVRKKLRTLNFRLLTIAAKWALWYYATQRQLRTGDDKQWQTPSPKPHASRG